MQNSCSSSIPRGQPCPLTSLFVSRFISRSPFKGASSCVLENWNLGKFAWLRTISSAPMHPGCCAHRDLGSNYVHSSMPQMQANIYKDVQRVVSYTKHVAQLSLFAYFRTGPHKAIPASATASASRSEWGAHHVIHAKRLDRDPTWQSSPSIVYTPRSALAFYSDRDMHYTSGRKGQRTCSGDAPIHIIGLQQSATGSPIAQSQHLTTI
jgi:hypothetical protein